jgi:hypothetical protein
MGDGLSLQYSESTCPSLTCHSYISFRFYGFYIISLPVSAHDMFLLDFNACPFPLHHTIIIPVTSLSHR